MDWTSVIVAAMALLGTAIGSYSGFKLTSYRVEQLERKVDKHNGFAERIPLIELEISALKKRLSNMEANK